MGGVSYSAVAWALAQPVNKSAAKFVLVAIASYATDDMLSWPSIKAVADATAQDRKTVLASVAKLVDLGFIEDTGQRKGQTGQVIVYRLKSAENGTVEQSQKRNSTENGTVPNFPSNSTVFPVNSTVFPAKSPKNGTRNKSEPIRTNQEPVKARAKIALPDWLPADLWSDWEQHRKSIKKPMSPKAAELSLASLTKLRDQGHEPRAVIELAIERGWQGLFAPRDGPPGAKPSVAARFDKTHYEGTPDDQLPDFFRRAS